MPISQHGSPIGSLPTVISASALPSGSWPRRCKPIAPIFRGISKSLITCLFATGLPTCDWSMPKGTCSDIPAEHGRDCRGCRLCLAQPFHADFQSPKRCLPLPIGARHGSGERRFHNFEKGSSQPWFLLNSHFFLPKRQNQQQEFFSLFFSANFVLEFFGLKPCFPSRKIPVLHVRLSDTKR